MNRAEKVARHVRRSKEFGETALAKLAAGEHREAGRAFERARDFAHLANAEQEKGK
jgi:hypothetical protein